MITRYLAASAGFEKALRAVPADGWTAGTPCTEWNVRQLVNHVVRGNHLNHIMLTQPALAMDYRRSAAEDVLGDDPLQAFAESTQVCAEAFRQHPDAKLVYPMGPIPASRALALRTTDVIIHTWDLARAVGADETLDPELVAWADDAFAETYAGLLDRPGVFATPAGQAPSDRQAAFVHRAGRTP